eukprot:2437709-Rhodomonas_salina.1
MDRLDNTHRAGGAAPTLALGRLGAAGSDSGSVSCSIPPAGCTLTTKGSQPNGTPPPLARQRRGEGWGFPQHAEGV